VWDILRGCKHFIQRSWLFTGEQTGGQMREWTKIVLLLLNIISELWRIVISLYVGLQFYRIANRWLWYRKCWLVCLKLTVLVNSGISVVWTRESIYLKWYYWFQKFLTYIPNRLLCLILIPYLTSGLWFSQFWSEKNLFLKQNLIWRKLGCRDFTNTGLLKMIVRVLTTCHTQYTWDRSM
jgi:hypothetical protein